MVDCAETPIERSAPRWGVKAVGEEVINSRDPKVN